MGFEAGGRRGKERDGGIRVVCGCFSRERKEIKNRESKTILIKTNFDFSRFL